MSCFVNCFDLGCIEHCASLELIFNAIQSGVHTWHFKSNNGHWSKEVTYTLGDAIVLDLKDTNETDCIFVRLNNPDGTIYDFGGTDCLKLETYISNEI